MSTPQQFGWGVIGCGRMVEKRMAPALIASSEVRSVSFCSRDLSRGREFCQRFGGGSAYDDLDQMLSNDDIEIVYIALPHTLHATTTMQCLAAGKHVLVDKPAATHAKDVLAMVQAAAIHNRTLRVLHQQRYHPANQTLIHLVANQELGRVHLIRMQIGMWMRGYSAWRFDPKLSGGGALMDLGPHALDLLITMLGTPVGVSARTADLAMREQVEDFCALTLEFDDNRIALADFSYSSHAYGGQIDVFGSEGTVVVRGSMQQARTWSMLRRTGSDEGNWTTQTDVGDCFGDAITDMHRAVTENVISQMDHYIHIATVIDAAYESAATGRRLALR